MQTSGRIANVRSNAQDVAAMWDEYDETEEHSNADTREGTDFHSQEAKRSFHNRRSTMPVQVCGLAGKHSPDIRPRSISDYRMQHAGDQIPSHIPHRSLTRRA